MNAMLLAAGLGTRFNPITLKIPKPTVPLLNVPLMGYSLYYLEKLGLKNLVINTHHIPHKIKSITECLIYKQNYKVDFSHEPEILGSGGGIKHAQALLDSNQDFIVANADEVLFFNHKNGYSPLLEFHKKNGALATLLTTRHEDAGKQLGGVWAEPNGKITKLGGVSELPGALHFTGVFIFSPRIFNFMPPGEFHIFNDCLHRAMAAGEKVLSFCDPELIWLDATSEKDFINSTRRALELLYENKTVGQNLGEILRRFHQNFETVADRQWLCSGAKFDGTLDPDSFLFMGENSHLCEGTQVNGFAVMGANSTFGPGFVESAVVTPNTHISELVAIRNQLVIE